MRNPRSLALAAASALTMLGATALRAQQDGLIAHPDVYRLQFENEWVRVIRVNVPAGASLAEHTHPPGVMVHVYLNDADPIVFEHGESPGTVTRPYVTARSYRIGRATPETHAVINRGRGASDYMRIEFKAPGSGSRGQRFPAPPLGTATTAVVEVTNDMYRLTRITVAARQTFEVSSGAEPALLIALTEAIAVDSAGGAPRSLKLGQERFIDAGRREVIRNSGDAPVELLRVDFIAKPAARTP